MLETLAIYSLLTSALFYLGSRARITSFLWRRYPPRLASFMDCAACTGFWWGLLIAAIRHSPSVPSALSASDALFAPIMIALSMIVLTPITAGLMQRGLDTLGTIQDEQEPHDDASED